MLELLKIVCQPVLLERDPDGQVVGEKMGEVVNCYSDDDFARLMEALRAAVERENAELVPSTDGGVHADH